MRRPSYVAKANTWLYVEQSMENNIKPIHDLIQNASRTMTDKV